MVAPPTADLEIPAHPPFALKAEPRHERDRTAIARLDVRFEPVQAKLEERQIDDVEEPLAHEPGARMGHEGVVAEPAGLLRLAHDVVDVDDADELLGLGRHDEERLLVVAPRAAQIVPIFARRCRSDDEASMQFAAAMSRIEIVALAPCARPLQANASPRQTHGLNAGVAACYGSSSTCSCLVSTRSAGDTLRRSAIALAT